MSEHWAARYIGLPWKLGATGPEEYDCWGFFRHVQRVHFHLDVPPVAYGPNWRDAAQALLHDPEVAQWHKVSNPREGDAVMMARSKLPVHIGIWIHANGVDGVLHALQGVGVVYHPFKLLSANGWGSIHYYRSNQLE